MNRNACDLSTFTCRCSGQGASAVEPKDGAWFVIMGHAGFNSPANNRLGYKSEAAARGAVKHYQGKTARVGR